MNKTVFWVLLLIFTTSNAFGLNAAEKAHAEKLYQETFPTNKEHDRSRIARLSDEERRLLIEGIRDYLAPFSGDQETLWFKGGTRILYLAQLGDDWALQASVEHFLQWSTETDTLELLRDPKVIAMIGEHLFDEEKFRWEGGDLGIFPIQYNVSQVIVSTLGNSPAFNSDVINWARRLRAKGWTAELLRPWYRANEAKLKAGDFKAVQPGAEPPERRDSPSDGHSRSSLPPGAAAGTTSSSSPGRTQTPDNSRNAYAWIATLLLAICGVLIWLLKRKRI